MSPLLLLNFPVIYSSLLKNRVVGKVIAMKLNNTLTRITLATAIALSHFSLPAVAAYPRWITLGRNSDQVNYYIDDANVLISNENRQHKYFRYKAWVGGAWRTYVVSVDCRNRFYRSFEYYRLDPSWWTQAAYSQNYRITSGYTLSDSAIYVCNNYSPR